MVLIKPENCLLNDGKRPSIKDILEKRRNCKDIFGLGEAKMIFATPEKQTEEEKIPDLTEKEEAMIKGMFQSNPK